MGTGTIWLKLSCYRGQSKVPGLRSMYAHQRESIEDAPLAAEAGQAAGEAVGTDG
jgi:hypothetical protein